jgi:hypothetical protein
MCKKFVAEKSGKKGIAQKQARAIMVFHKTPLRDNTEYWCNFDSNESLLIRKH